MELPEMPEQGYVVLFTNENREYLSHLANQLDPETYPVHTSGYALNVYELMTADRLSAFLISSPHSSILKTSLEISADQLKYFMFMYYLEN